MPDISKINALAIGSVSKVDGLAKASILDIDGVAVPSAFTGLLDTYTGAAAAYSTRKLKTGVTVAARIRRSGDDIEADVEFDSNNEISLTSPISNASSGTYTDLADFVDHATTPRDAFVKEWKDQSGNGNDATQSTGTNQPKLYDATTGLIIENGKPGLLFDFNILNLSSQISFTGSTHIQSVCEYKLGRFLYGGPSGHFLQVEAGAGAGTMNYRGFGADVFGTPTYTANEQSSQTVARDASSDCRIYYKGTLLDTELNRTATTYLDRIGDGNGATSGVYDGIFQELIAWQVDQTSNRTGIEENINSEYLIYQPTDAPTSGLLATYTGAAAAYSVRQLSDKALIAMRIRRDSDDEERNIGWDSNGDLDTTAISDFCGTANGYVTRWWDQSTNGKHTDQATDTSQPQIYNGTAVITENGKPALYFNLDKVELTGLSWGSTRTIFTTLKPVSFDGFDPLFGTRDASGNFAALIGTTTSGNYNMQQYPSGNFNNVNTGIAITTDQQLIYTLFDGPSSEIAKDAASATSVSLISANAENHSIGARGTDSGGGEFYMQEHIVYTSDQTSNRTGIEQNINGYFSIYT